LCEIRAKFVRRSVKYLVKIRELNHIEVRRFGISSNFVEFLSNFRLSKLLTPAWKIFGDCSIPFSKVLAAVMSADCLELPSSFTTKKLVTPKRGDYGSVLLFQSFSSQPQPSFLTSHHRAPTKVGDLVL